MDITKPLSVTVGVDFLLAEKKLISYGGIFGNGGSI